MKGKGIVLLAPDKVIQAKAKSAGLPVVIDAEMPLPFDKQAIVAAGTTVPWDLLPAAWNFLERWDAAVPLWRYGVTAEGVGTPAERERTKAVIRDLRVLLHSIELLFVRNSTDGQALMAAYRAELVDGGERRLAFLRAMYQVKPRLCVLPRSWLAEIEARSKQDSRAQAARPPRPRKGEKLVSIEIAPGRFVKCNRGDEAKVKEQFAQQATRRQCSSRRRRGG